MPTITDPTPRPTATTRVEVRRPASRDDWRQAEALLLDHVEWMRSTARFDPFVAQPALASEAARLEEHYCTAAAALYLAFDGPIAVGVVAMRCGDDGAAELKRMYVRPVARGTGVADALITAVIEAAARLGCRAVWLETLRGVMDRAIAVYRRHGFAERDDGRRTLDLDGIVVMERPVP